MTKKTVIVPAIILTIVGGIAAFGASNAYAQNAQGRTPSIIQELATKFGLNVNDVKAVFDQNRQERQAQMETNFEQRLTQAVTAGKLTEAQKQLIIAKRKEIQTAHQNQQKIQRQDVLTWAKQNNIDPQYLFGLDGFRMGMRPGMGSKWRQNTAPTQSPAPTPAQ